MIKEINENRYGIEATADSSWNKDITLVCNNKDQLSYAEKCLDYLDHLPIEVEKRLAKYIYRYYKDFEQYFTEEELKELGTVNENNIFNYIEILSLIVDDECITDKIEFHAYADCVWEIEHGLEFTISDDRILYVGSYEDYGPNSKRLLYALENYGYYDPEADPSMNYTDKE